MGEQEEEDLNYKLLTISRKKNTAELVGKRELGNVCGRS